MKVKLTEVQKAYLLGRNESFDGNIGTHMYVELKFKGNILKFEKSFNKIIKKQPMLRASVLNVNEFEIIDNYTYNINIHYEEKTRHEAKKLLLRKELSHKHYSSDDFPFYNIQALTCDNENYIIFVSIDLLIADGLSLFKLLEQMKSEYFSLRSLEEDQAEKLIYINNKYFEEKQSKRFKKSKIYWNGKIKTLPNSPQILVSENRVKRSKFERKEYCFNKEELIKMEGISKEMGVSLSSILLTLYAATLQDWSANKKFTLNMTTFKRPRKDEFIEVLGDFTSTMLVETNIRKDQTLLENSREINKEIFKGLRNSSFEGVEVLREISRNENKIATMPYVFTSMLFDLDSFDDFVQFDYWISETPQVYVDCQIKKMNGMLHVSWDFLKDIFEESLISEMFNQYVKYMKLFIKDNENIFINENNNKYTEIQELYNKYNSNRNIINCPTDNIINAFNKISSEHKNKIAFIDQEKDITFKELNDLSEINVDKIKKFKDDNKLKKIRVAIEGTKNIKTIIHILSVIKSGDSFCFIPKDMPIMRKKQLDQTCNFNIYIRDDEFIINHVENVKIPLDELYIIFTSGTTGTPKGISINQAGALNTIDDIIERFNLSYRDFLFNISEFSFDLSIFDIITPFLTGATTVICNNISEISNFTAHFKKVTVWNSTPGLVEALFNYECAVMSNLKYIMISGDAISNALVKKIVATFNNQPIEIYSFGGATEASIWSIYYPLNNINDKRIPYGYPLSNQQLYVIDENDNLSPPFCEGEIVISGAGLANGYLNESENEGVFYKHNTLGNLYRTGDKGYFSYDGVIHIVGRIKSELKINGYRIDLVEIEKCTNDIHHIKSSKVLIRKNKNNKTQILVFYTTKNGEGLTNQYLRKSLKSQLPHYMIPTKFIWLKELPLTQNGKIDTQTLLNHRLDINEFEQLNKDEIKMATIWLNIVQEDIDINKLSSKESFFDIGGDSIMLTELINIINQEYKINISIEELLSNFTLKELTIFVNKKIKQGVQLNTLSDNIVKLSNGDENKNLVFIHAGSGEIAIYNNLAKLLSPHYNIYAIKYSKDMKKVNMREINFAEIAKAYNDDLKSIGKIDLIGGWCIGGTIGFEIAKINEDVENVLLINSLAPVENNEEIFSMDLDSEITFIDSIINYNFKNIKDTKELWNTVIQLLNKRPDLITNVLNKIPADLARLIPFFGENSPADLIYYINLFRSFERARFLYNSISKISQPLIYIGAKEEVVSNYIQWGKYTTSHFSEEHIKGDHTTIFSDENVKCLSKAINKHLA